MARRPHNHRSAERLRADHRHFRFDPWQLTEAESFAQFPLNQNYLSFNRAPRTAGNSSTTAGVSDVTHDTIQVSAGATWRKSLAMSRPASYNDETGVYQSAKECNARGIL